MSARHVCALVGLSLLFVPALPVTISILRAPAPWHLLELQDSASAVLLIGTLTTLVMVWVVYPFTVAMRVRTWWWPVLCLLIVPLTALAWNGGYAIFPPDGYRYHADDVAATLWIVGDAVILASVAAAAAAMGIIRSPWWGTLIPLDRTICITIGMSCAVVPLVVIPIVLLTTPTHPETPWMDPLMKVIWVVAWLGWAFAGGQWIRRPWWVLYCFWAPIGVILVWGVRYADSLRFAPHAYMALQIFLIGILVSTVATVAAGAGVSFEI